MISSQNEDNSIKSRYLYFQTEILIRISIAFGFFVAGLVFRFKNSFDQLLSLHILLILSPLVILWAILDTIFISLLRRRYSPPIFILLYKPQLSENRRRSILRWLFVLGILIGHILAVYFNVIIEFIAGLFLLTGMAGVGQSLTLYFSSKFDYEEYQV